MVVFMHTSAMSATGSGLQPPLLFQTSVLRLVQDSFSKDGEVHRTLR